MSGIMLVSGHVAAVGIWAEMGENERAGVRFGLFPASIMRNAQRDGYEARAVCLALMDCARRDGGMIA